ncbi:MAG: UbiX family flavin prenyltransferase [Nitrospinaceae bacterium]|jgi:4-hydroxy-3-polyprenylbenzoate decarboxylase|nr:UbiX family flavin prenyltransferase [Nitrospinaceae bacterium]HAK37947.1 aromatic acid decarboxylase [Nitrospina sp.]|tara:strand:- start:1119 stop:1673 length:555 start_codon:yes stop_codon:yes gene_type:complete
MKRFILGVTGASGVCYARRLFDVLKNHAELHVVISERGAELLKLELDLDSSYFSGDNVALYKNSKINSCIASGSFRTDGMVVVPASMGTIGRIASGISSTLVERAADVILKEKRKMIVVPRETPFSTIHLKNILALDQAGAVVLPASPGFYSGQKTFDDLVDFVVARILDQLDIEHDLMDPYQG